MKEEFLHHVWQYKKFSVTGLTTVCGKHVEILNAGNYLQQSGPDFFNSQLVIDGQRWAGNVEIHLKSSDWYLHSHESDPNYDNVILHVVWEHDTEVMRRNNTEIPVLELRHYTDPALLAVYNALASAKSWIYCEKELETIDSFVLDNWKERLFFERLERKAKPILESAAETRNDWEAVLFSFLAKNFGLNTNGDVFFAMARSLPFSIIRKESSDVANLEALFFGRCGMLNDNPEDVYPRDLKARYDYMFQKYRMEPAHVDHPEFFRHRPDNFPTIRLSQLAQLYSTHQNLFSKVIESASPEAIRSVFAVQASAYWNDHYRFDKESPKKRKGLTVSFIDLVVINTIVPFRFAYAKSIGKDNTEELVAFLQAIAPEKNAVIDKFRSFKVDAISAYDTQSLLQLRNEYCANKRCMQCALGLELLKK